ncbi:hypothetical protein [Thermotomaculum hydrothermale]|uniref:hypothetical protein n=1 Tax=Thermotomaculum hydrothermale TaxID=981385 RepID=UPI001915079E|nr:hypothetical protein [Thermotomaculum hydrothermale]
MRRITTILFFITFSIFSLVLGVHHHSDNRPHPECSLCVLQHDFSSTASLDLPLNLFFDKIFIPFPEIIYSVYIVKLIKPSGRCPPFSSFVLI